MDQEIRSPSGSLRRMLQVRVRLVFVEPFAGTGIPSSGGKFSPVLKVYHRRVNNVLPVGSVAFTHTIYEENGSNPYRDNDFVPFVAFAPLFDCPLLHWIVQEKRSPSESTMEILQAKLRWLVVVPFAGVGDPKDGGKFPVVVKIYHRLVYEPFPNGSVAFTHTLYVVVGVNPESTNDFVPFDAPVPLLVCPLVH
jgi:hypothetical protein